MSLLTVENLSLSIGTNAILREVGFTVDAGEILGIIGESGSGKSMTALAVMQLLPRAAELQGLVRFDGTDMITAGEDRLCDLRGNDLGMVFQEPMTALNPVKSIGAQVAETLRIHQPGLSKQMALSKAAEVLTRCELPPGKFPLSRYPHELSGGQRQRVVIAIAMAAQPKLLIADEPTTALDVTTQAEILILLKRLVQEDGLGLILISHDLAVVADMVDHLVIMKDGEIVEQGKTQAVLTHMRHPYTKALFAASTHIPDPIQTTQDEPLLRVEDVCRDYPLPRKSPFAEQKFFRAVNGVTFEIKRGESLGLVGESGCGKSTLTRAILGLEPVQSGAITLDGAPVFTGKTPNRDVRRRMQVVFQDPFGSFNPRQKVGRLVAEPFHLLDDVPDRDKAVSAALEAVGLSAQDRHKYIHEFSGGQRQRIAIARAIIIRPDLVVLDEAVSALDVSIRAQILDLLSQLRRDFGLTYLFISHDLSVVRAVTDRVLVMKAGQIVERGETEMIFTAPQHDYTQTLISAAPQLELS